jgi:hypothetical protein
MAVSGGKHVMLSYNSESRHIVTKVYDILVEAGIPTWMDVKGGMGDKLNRRYGSRHDCYFLNTVTVLFFA